MPFPQQNPIPFSREGIERINPNQPGCYGIFAGQTCVYVGSTNDLRTRMLQHFGGDNACIINNRPTYWVGAVTRDYENEEVRLTLEYQPICNKRVG